VWICPLANGHIQATGRDARGRKQYRYHDRWRAAREETKYGQLLDFAAALPAIRKRVAADLRRSGLPREKVLATVVRLLDLTLIRVGNDEYRRDNGSVGLTTMRDSNVRISGGTITFRFRGKSQRWHTVEVHDERLARVVRRCRDIPGYELFQYVDDEGNHCAVDSGEVNEYLREVSGGDFTAKDFRTWAGSVCALRELAASNGGGRGPRRGRGNGPPSDRARARTVVTAVAAVSERLGNTPAVCRRSYVHPGVIDAYLSGALDRPVTPVAVSARTRGLDADERALVALLRGAAGPQRAAS
jgi:DNA topoisomerase-1